MRLVLPLFAALLALTPAALQAQPAGGPGGHPGPATLSVQGTGEVNAAPDIAQIQIGVASTAESAGAAMTANNGAAQKVFDFLKGQGIAPEDMQTVEVSINPQYRDRRTTDGVQEIVGYTVQNRLSVTVRRLDALGKVLDGVVTAGANTISGISFDVAGRNRLEDEALAAAVADARARADLMAKAAGVSVDRVLEMSAGGSAPPRPMYARAEMSSVPIAPGSLTVSVSVNVVYAIR